MKRKEKKIFEKVIVTCLGLALVLALIIILIRVFTPAMKVRDSALIEETLETADDTSYAEEKSMLADLIEERYNCTPEKVVFFIYAPHDAMDFDVTIYYKDDGTWFHCLLESFSPDLSGELYDRLSYLATQ